MSLLVIHACLCESWQLPGSGLKQEQMRRDWIKFTRKTICLRVIRIPMIAANVLYVRTCPQENEAPGWDMFRLKVSRDT